MKFSDMPIRDFYALEVIQGIVARGEARSEIQVRQAYDVADAMLKFQAGENALRDHEMAALRKRAEEAERTLEILRPVYAQYPDGGCMSSALAELWEALGAEHQTAAMQRIRDLLQWERNG